MEHAGMEHDKWKRTNCNCRPRDCTDECHELVEAVGQAFDALCDALDKYDDIPPIVVRKARSGAGLEATLGPNADCGEYSRVAFGLYREMHVALDAAGIDVGEISAFGDLAGALTELCAELECTRHFGPSQTAFIRISDAASSFVEFLSGQQAGVAVKRTRRRFVKAAVKVSTITQVLDVWEGTLPIGEFSVVRERITALTTHATCIQSAAQEAALTCDDESMQYATYSISMQLVEMQERYRDVLCELDRLLCVPEVEEPMIREIKAAQAQADYYLAELLEAFGRLCLTADDIRAHLLESWQYLNLKAMAALNCEIERYVDAILCAPPDFCVQARTRLTALIAKGLAEAASFSCDAEGQVAAHWETVTQLYTSVDHYREQAQHTAGFKSEVFDHFISPIRSVMLLVQGCRSETDPLLRFTRIASHLAETITTIQATQKRRRRKFDVQELLCSREVYATLLDVARLFQWFTKSSKACVGVCSVSEGVKAPAQPYSPSRAQSVWTEGKKVMETAYTLAAEAHKKRIKELAVLSDQALGWLNGTAAQAHTADSLRRIRREWGSYYAACDAAIIAAQRELPSASKQERESLEALRQRLSLQNQQMSRALGV